MLKRIRPTDPTEDERWKDAVHEAAHGILFAYAGACGVCLTTSRGLTRPRLRRDKNPIILLPGAFGGYAADIVINRCTELEAGRRSRTDRCIAIRVLHDANEPITECVLRKAEVEARKLVVRFRKEICTVANALMAKDFLSEEHFESLAVVRAVRGQGHMDRGRLTDPSFTATGQQ